MPREAWPLCRSLYCEKFMYTISLQALQKQVNAAITNTTGRPCLQKPFLGETTKRVKIRNTYFVRYMCLSFIYMLHISSFSKAEVPCTDAKRPRM
ncbi:unnamed protein product [Thelazia callipaeda]|uniref:Secreted protein n=1 Tax=Thelazia callipaeda TaxID=103827 RepID=A0A0N5D4Q0_THECL|nr:unnamed protein product [Thelazia callipaeda]